MSKINFLTNEDITFKETISQQLNMTFAFMSGNKSWWMLSTSLLYSLILFVWWLIRTVISVCWSLKSSKHRYDDIK